MIFDREKFSLFFSQLPIPAKEGGGEGTGVGRRLPLSATQVYVTNQFIEGLEGGEHIFWILKGRQVMVTTWALAVIAYWAMTHPGMIFTHIAPDTKLAEVNRALLSGMLRGLPEEWGLPQNVCNRVMMEFSNGSRIIWLNANATKGRGSGLGQGIGMLGVHGTELGSWNDEDGVKSLMASLAQKNPERLYIFEGTSKGAGLFKDYWEGAASEGTTGRSSARALFVGWWLNPYYKFDLSDKKDRRLHEHYWRGQTTRSEQGRVEEVKRRYNFDFCPEQLSWWRWMADEPFKNREEHLFQEFPWLPEDAWMYGAKGYIDAATVNIASKRLQLRHRRAESAPQAFNYRFVRTSFDESGFEPAPFEKDAYDLLLFEPPAAPSVDKKIERLIISCDPTHGANEKSDKGVIQVWRAHTDKLVQVAEYVKANAPAYHLVWVILELAALYDAQAKVIIELQGGGISMHDEMQKLQSYITTGYNKTLCKYFERLDFYRYARLDAVHRGGRASYQWFTNQRTKPFMLERLSDYFSRDMLTINSLELVQEIAATTKNSSGEIVPSREDNRLMCAGMAVAAWLDLLSDELLDIEKYSYNQWLAQAGKVVEGQEVRELEPSDAYLKQRVLNWKKQIRKDIVKDRERERLLNSGEYDSYVDDWDSGVAEDWPEEENLY